MKKITALVLVLVLALSFALTSFATADPPTYLAKFDNEATASTLATDNTGLAWGQAYLLNGYFFDYKSGSGTTVATENAGTDNANTYIAVANDKTGSDFAVYPSNAKSLVKGLDENIVVSYNIRFNSDTAFTASGTNKPYLEVFTARSNGPLFVSCVKISSDFKIYDGAVDLNQEVIADLPYATINIGAWTNIAAVINIKNLSYRFYVNGVEVTTAPVTCKLANNGVADNFQYLERVKYYVLQGGVCQFDVDDVEMYMADEPYVYESPDTGSVGLTVFAVITSVAGLGIIGTTVYLRKKSAKAAK